MYPLIYILAESSFRRAICVLHFHNNSAYERFDGRQNHVVWLPKANLLARCPNGVCEPPVPKHTFLRIALRTTYLFCDFVDRTQWNSQSDGIVNYEHTIPRSIFQLIQNLVVISITFTICPDSVAFDFQRLRRFLQSFLK